MENQNKKHWDEMGETYGNVWKNKSKQYMHSREMTFINNFLNKKEVRRGLDIGVGSGRILENYLANSEVAELYGIDISDEMVKFCKEKFKENNRIQKMAVCDFSKENIPFEVKFDFISAIRVLKYNKNWKEMVKKITDILNDGGVAVFTMPNKYSLNIFGTYSIPYYRTSKKELANLCKQSGLKILDLQSFTRIPDVIYNFSNNKLYSDCVVLMEKALSLLFGKVFFGRMFFIAVKKLTMTQNK